MVCNIIVGKVDGNFDDNSHEEKLGCNLLNENKYECYEKEVLLYNRGFRVMNCDIRKCTGVIGTCKISTKHFAHCPALNYCIKKSITTNNVSIVEEAFGEYVESSKAVKRTYKSIKSFYSLQLDSNTLEPIETMRTEILSTITDAYKTEFRDLFVSLQILGLVIDRYHLITDLE